MGQGIGFAQFVDEAGGSLASSFVRTSSSDDSLAAIANGLVFGFRRYTRAVTINPPTGLLAYPVSVAAIAEGTDSFFSYLGFAPEDGDQALVPLTYSGGTITWAVSGAYATGKIASKTGVGDFVFSLAYWRQATAQWQSIAINVHAGVIVAATAVIAASAAQTQTLGSPTLSARGPLATAGLSQAQLLSATALKRNISPASISNDQTIARPLIRPKYALSPAALVQAQLFGVTILATRAPVTYTRSITLAPPTGYTALPVAAASANSGVNSAFRGLAFLPANGDQFSPPIQYAGGAITWATASGNATGVISSATGAGNDTLIAYYWRASNTTWYQLTLTMSAGAVVPANALQVNGIVSGQSLSQPGLNGATLTSTYSRSITLNPPAGFSALPISAATASVASNSAFARLGFSPSNNDQCLVPTTYTGGSISWESTGGNMTGRIASFTGAGDATLSLQYWRSVTGIWQTYTVNMVSGAIAASGPASLVSVQTLGNVSLSGSSVTYSRSLTLNPPAGYQAYPISADLVTYVEDSIFSALIGVAVTGDQCVVPTTYNDGGTARPITWEAIGGFITGRIAEIEGSAPSSLSILYWDSTTAAWLTLSITLADRTGLVLVASSQVQTIGSPSITQRAHLAVAGLASLQSLGLPSITGSGVSTPKINVSSIAQQVALAASALQPKFTLPVSGFWQPQSLGMSGVKRSGGIGVFSLVSETALSASTLQQLNRLIPHSLYHVQALNPASIGFSYVLSVLDLSQQQTLKPSSIGALKVNRLDSRQTISQSRLETPVESLLYGAISIYPELTAQF